MTNGKRPVLLLGFHLWLTDWIQVEQMRRSIAMLPPKAAALNREQALRVLDALADQEKRAADD